MQRAILAGPNDSIGYEEIDCGSTTGRRFVLPYGGATRFRTDVFQEFGEFDPIFDPIRGPDDLDFSGESGMYSCSAPYVTMPSVDFL
jgi:hypothetical protein